MTNPLFEKLFSKHENSERIFLSFIDGSFLTYGEYIKIVSQFSSSFRAMGLKPGDRVALKIKKSKFFLGIYGACIHQGLIFLPINDKYTTEETFFFLKDSQTRLLISTGQEVNKLKNTPDSFFHTETLENNGTGSLSTLAEPYRGLANPKRRTSKDIAALLYTSGTTGRPKAAMITQENLISNVKTLTEYWKFTAEDVLIHALPVYHTHGLFVATNIVLFSGASMFFLEKFDTEMILSLMPKATTLMGVPTYYSRLLETSKLSKDLIKGLRLVISGSAPLTKKSSDRFFEKTGKRILERYGMTETNMISSNPYFGDRKSGTVGFPLPGIKLRICDPETGIKLPKGKVGEIEIKGKNVFKGYWGLPEKTRENFRSDGFFRTGDLGKFDNEGFLEISSRLKDLIITGGLNVYPKEVEKILDSCPKVKESAVIGLRHSDFGEAVVAIIISNNKNNGLDPNYLKSYLESKLAKYKCPKAYIFQNSLPRNPLGKVLKSLLREKYMNFFNK
ncbi:MAG: AMP-binding protein [Paracoccaceae bacterium]